LEKWAAEKPPFLIKKLDKLLIIDYNNLSPKKGTIIKVESRPLRADSAIPLKAE
jgi:hypothetical protein